MNKRKLTVILLLTVVVVFAIAIFVLAGCGDDYEEHHITSIEELEELASVPLNDIEKMILILDNDLDFANKRLESSIKCYEFRGNGHTISNVMLDNSFFSYAHIISDVTFEGLTLNNVTDSANTAFVLSNASALEGEINIIEGLFHVSPEKYGAKISNVHVKNSTATITQGEEPGSFGGIVGVYAAHNYAENPVLTNCSVDNITCTVEAGANPEITGALWDLTPINVGGLVGVASSIDISNCSVTNSKISVTANGIGNDIYLGGMVARLYNTNNGNSVSWCYASDNELTASGRWSSGNIVNEDKSTSEVRVGGFICELNDNDVANHSKFVACYSDGNKIDITCSGLYTAGGFGARLSSAEYAECYSVNNNVVARGRNTSDTSRKNRNFGGFGGASSGTITSCYAYNNSITDTYKNQLLEDGDEERLFGGFLGQSNNTVISYCAAGLSDMTQADRTSAFCSSNSNSIIETCYCDSTSSDSQLNPITNSQFLDFTALSEMLMLTDSRWESSNNSPAVLNLD